MRFVLFFGTPVYYEIRQLEVNSMVLCFFSKVVVFEKGFEILVTLGEKGRKEEKPTETRALREYGELKYTREPA